MNLVCRTTARAVDELNNRNSIETSLEGLNPRA
jgi:hypothetical protein